ncbi:MAG: SpoIIE family protein phosphatase [Lachnospiraceae bacterium]|nr:SpoIIE family protein phosphatase [Lachnospiraceae bacterium]
MKKGFLMKTIQMRLLVPILCAIVVGGTLMGIVAYRTTAERINKAGISDGLRSVQGLREMLDMTIATARFDLSTLASSPNLKYNLLEEWVLAPDLEEGAEFWIPAVKAISYTSANDEEWIPSVLETQMLELIERQPLYNSMIALNTDGVIIASTSGSAGQVRADREYFIESLKGNSFISPVEVSRQTGRLASFVSIPIYDGKDGPIIGVMMAALQIREINTRYVVPVTLLDAYGYAMIVNESGIIIGHNDDEKLGEEISDEILNIISGVTDEALVFEIEIDGIPSIIFIERCQSTEWFPIIVSSISDFHKTINEVARINTIMVILVILLIAVLVWLAVSGVTKALSTTIRYAGAVAHGELDTPLNVEREDEVGILADSLRDMVGKLKNMINIAEQKTMEAEEAKDTLLSGIIYASRIQGSLLPKNTMFAEAFSDHAVKWDPRDIVGGDIYWLKKFDEGCVLCVCDCTGHGTPGALLTMLVVSALEAVVKQSNYQDTAEIIWQLEKRLINVLHVETEDNTLKGRNIGEINDGCDIAILYIANTGAVTLSSGHMHVFVCDGKETHQYKGQNISVGEGKLKSKNDIKTVNIPPNPDNKYYVATDGLYDQIGGKATLPFGYNRFKKIILENHNIPQSDIIETVWQAFEIHRGSQPRRDDFQLIGFKPQPEAKTDG